MRTFEVARRTTGGLDLVAYKLKKLSEKEAAACWDYFEDEETEEDGGNEEEEEEEIENPRKKLRSFKKESLVTQGTSNESSVDGDENGDVGGDDEEGLSSFSVEEEPTKGEEESALLKLLQGKNEEIQLLTKMLQEANEKKKSKLKRWKDEALGSRGKLRELETEAKRQNELLEKLRNELLQCSNEKDAANEKNVDLLEKLKSAEAVEESYRALIDKVRRGTEEQAKVLGLLK